MSTKPFRISDHNRNSIVTIYGYSGTQFVVGLAGEAPYTNIQSAIDDAYTLADSSNSAQVVYVKPGLYVENLSFLPGVAVVGTEVPSTLDNVSYDPTDVSQNYGVFVQGTHTFDQSLGEFNVKNIIFFPKSAGDSDIIDFTGSDTLTSTYTFENCKFLALDSNVIFGAKFFNCTSLNAAYEGLAVFFKSCLFYAKDNNGDDDHCMFTLLGSNGTKYVFDNCTIKSTWTSGDGTAYLEAIDGGLGDAWYVNFSNCKIDRVSLLMTGGSYEIILSVDNCNLTSYDAPVIQFNDSCEIVRVINSYIYVTDPSSNAINGDPPHFFDSTGTIFASGSPGAPSDWLAALANWPNTTNNTIVSSGPVYCVYSDNQDQEAAVANTAYPMRFNTFEEGYGITVENDSQSPPQPTKITFQYPGVYNLQFSAQLDRVSGSGNADVNIWLRKNGTTGAANVANTDTRITMSGSASASKTVAAWNLMFSAAAGDYVQLCWATQDVHIEIIHGDAVTTVGQERPAIPSVILTVYKIK
jgi:hypothetical protein